MDLSQEEFLRFLNCRVVLNKDQFEKQTVLDAKNRPVTIIKQHDANMKQVKSVFAPEKTRGLKRRRNVSSFGRKIKQKKLSDGFVTEIKEESKSSTDDSEIIPVARSTPARRKINNKNDSKELTSSKQKNGAIVKSEVLPEIRSVPSKPSLQTHKSTSLPHRTNRNSRTINDLEQRIMSEPTYYLQFPKTTYPIDGRLNYKFQDLVLDIKNMQLPSPVWKIKVVIKKNKIASIVFTNKCQPERSVTFSAKSPFFYVTIDNRAALLLGSPQTVDSVNDIEVLLNIVHNIDPRNPMILYK